EREREEQLKIETKLAELQRILSEQQSTHMSLQNELNVQIAAERNKFNTLQRQFNEDLKKQLETSDTLIAEKRTQIDALEQELNKLKSNARQTNKTELDLKQKEEELQ